MSSIYKDIRNGVEKRFEKIKESMEGQRDEGTSSSGGRKVIDETYDKISPKGRRQVQRFLQIIKGRPEDCVVKGSVQGVEMRVICCAKSKYDTITTGAIAAIKSKGGAVRCERSTSALPKILRRERMIDFEIARVEIMLHGYSTRISPVVIKTEEIGVTLSGGSTNMILGIALCRQGFDGGKIMMERKGRELLRLWTKKDKDGGDEKQSASEKAENNIEEAGISPDTDNQQESEELNSSEESSEEEEINSMEVGPNEETDRDTEARFEEIMIQENVEEEVETTQEDDEGQGEEEQNSSDEDDETVKDEDLPYSKLKRRKEKWKREIKELEERKRKREELLISLKRLRERKEQLKKDLKEEEEVREGQRKKKRGKQIPRLKERRGKD